MDSITREDAFDNMMSAFDASASLLCMLSERGGQVLNERDATLCSRVFRDMVDARDAFEEVQDK